MGCVWSRGFCPSDSHLPIIQKESGKSDTITPGDVTRIFASCPPKLTCPLPILNWLCVIIYTHVVKYQQLDKSFKLICTNTSKRFTKYKAEQYFKILMNPRHEFQFLAVDWDRKVSHKRQSYVSYKKSKIYHAVCVKFKNISAEILDFLLVQILSLSWGGWGD